MQSNIDISKFSGAALQVLDASQLLVFAAPRFHKQSPPLCPRGACKGDTWLYAHYLQRNWLGHKRAGSTGNSLRHANRMNHLCRSAARGPGCTRKWFFLRLYIMAPVWAKLAFAIKLVGLTKSKAFLWRHGCKPSHPQRQLLGHLSKFHGCCMLCQSSH